MVATWATWERGGGGFCCTPTAALVLATGAACGGVSMAPLPARASPKRRGHLTDDFSSHATPAQQSRSPSRTAFVDAVAQRERRRLNCASGVNRRLLRAGMGGGGAADRPAAGAVDCDTAGMAAAAADGRSDAQQRAHRDIGNGEMT